MMPTAVITVAGIKGPEAGKKRGRIQSQDGMIFQITPTLAEGIKLGESYTLDYTDEEFRDAKYRVVQSVMPSAAPKQSSPPPMTAGGSMSTAMSAEREEAIAAQAILKCQGPLPVGDTVAIFHALKAGTMAWRMFKKWQKDGNIESGPTRRSIKPEDPVDDDLNDEIPEAFR